MKALWLILQWILMGLYGVVMYYVGEFTLKQIIAIGTGVATLMLVWDMQDTEEK